jgi:hypothetical protein
MMPSLESPMRDGIPEEEEEMRANRENREIELNLIRNNIPMRTNFSREVKARSLDC